MWRPTSNRRNISPSHACASFTASSFYKLALASIFTWRRYSRAQFAALRRWQLTWAANRVKCYFKKALSAHVSAPLIARSAARICCRAPRWRRMPPGPKFGPATFVLSIQSVVLSEFSLQSGSLCLTAQRWLQDSKIIAEAKKTKQSRAH